MSHIEYVDYGFGEFEYIEDPFSKQYINGGSPMTNVAGHARIKDREKQGHRRRHPEHYERMATTTAFHRAMMDQFVEGMRKQLSRTSFLWFSDGSGLLPPPDPRTDWEQALDQCFYDPTERAEDELYFTRWCED